MAFCDTELCEIPGKQECAGFYHCDRIRDCNDPEVFDGRGIIAEAPAYPGHIMSIYGFRENQICFGTPVSCNHDRFIIQDNVFKQIPAGCGKTGAAQNQHRSKKQRTKQNRFHVFLLCSQCLIKYI